MLTTCSGVGRRRRRVGSLRFATAARVCIGVNVLVNIHIMTENKYFVQRQDKKYKIYNNNSNKKKIKTKN